MQGYLSLTLFSTLHIPADGNIPGRPATRANIHNSVIFQDEFFSDKRALIERFCDSFIL